MSFTPLSVRVSIRPPGDIWRELHHRLPRPGLPQGWRDLPVRAGEVGGAGAGGETPSAQTGHGGRSRRDTDLVPHHGLSDHLPRLSSGRVGES